MRHGHPTRHGRTIAGARQGLAPGFNNRPTTLYVAEGYTDLLHTKGWATVDESLAVRSTTLFTATVTITTRKGAERGWPFFIA